MSRKDNMAVQKKKTTKKVPIKQEPITVIEQKEATTEDLVLGKPTETVIKQIYNYEASSVKYKVTNLMKNNNPTIVTGDVIETFIGSKNKEARNQLKSGAKAVITKDYNNKDEYKIEVVE